MIIFVLVYKVNKVFWLLSFQNMINLKKYQILTAKQIAKGLLISFCFYINNTIKHNFI